MGNRRTARLGTTALAVTALAAVSACGGADSGSEAEFPSRTMTYVVPYSPGGSTDPVGREYSRMLGEELGGDFVVENLPGGDETIGLTSVFGADPDGYTMGLSSATGIVVQPLLNDELTFSGPEDYTALVKMVEAPNAIFVAADSPFETLDDLLEAATERPGEIRVGTTGRYTNNSFAIVSLEEQADVDLTLVPFSGGAGEAVLAALGGQVEAVIPTAAAQLGFVESGELRALAHTGSQEYGEEFLPGSVSFDEAGYDIPFSSDYVTVTGADVPEDVADQVREAAFAVAQSDEWAQWCADQGFTADPMTGEELDEWIQQVTTASEQAIALTEANEG